MVSDDHNAHFGGLVLSPNAVHGESRPSLELVSQNICITRCDWRPPLSFYNALIKPERMGTSENPYRPRWRYIKVHEPGKCKCKAARLVNRDKDAPTDVIYESRRLADIVAIWGEDGPGGATKADNEAFSMMLEWQAELKD